MACLTSWESNINVKLLPKKKKLSTKNTSLIRVNYVTLSNNSLTSCKKRCLFYFNYLFCKGWFDNFMKKTCQSPY